MTPELRQALAVHIADAIAAHWPDNSMSVTDDDGAFVLNALLEVEVKVSCERCRGKGFKSVPSYRDPEVYVDRTCKCYKGQRTVKLDEVSSS